MKLPAARLIGWGINGLLLGVAVGLVQRGWHQAPVATHEVPTERPVRLQPAVSAQQTVLWKSQRSPALRMLEKLATATRAELEEVTMEILAGKDYQLKNALWDRWIEVDAEAGYEGLMSGKFPAGNEKMIFVWAYIGRWSLADPDEAVARMLALGGRDLEIAGARISEALSSKRPADFFRLLPELRKGHDWEGHINTAGRGLAEQDPAAAVKLLTDWQGGPGDKARSRLVQALALGWARTDQQAAKDWAWGLQDADDRTKALTVVAQQIAGDQPEMSAVLLKEAYGFGNGDAVAEESKISQALRHVALDWTARDADAPLEWLVSEFGGTGKTIAHDLVADQIPRESAAAVDYLLRHFELLRDTEGALSASMHQWQPDDAAAGLAKAGEIPDGEQREAVEFYFLTAMASSSPQEAIAAAGERITDPVIKAGILKTAMNAWASADITAASQWLDSQQGGAERDAAIQGFLPTAIRSEQDSALYWAAALSTADGRSQEIASVFQRMRVREESDVREKLSGLPVPDSEKASILEQLKPMFPAKP